LRQLSNVAEDEKQLDQKQVLSCVLEIKKLEKSSKVQKKKEKNTILGNMMRYEQGATGSRIEMDKPSSENCDRRVDV
jgi:hypothetical protein